MPNERLLAMIELAKLPSRSAIKIEMVPPISSLMKCKAVLTRIAFRQSRYTRALSVFGFKDQPSLLYGINVIGCRIK